MTYSLTHALTPGATENITDVKENIEDAVGDALGVYRHVFQAEAIIDGGSAATYVLGAGGGGEGASPVTLSTGSLALLYLNSADYDVSGLTTKLRVRAQVAPNATAPANNFVTGLYPVTVAGGANSLVLTLGTVVSGSTVTLNTPSASTVSQGNSGDFTFPTAGAFAFGVALSGALAASSIAQISAQLQVRNV